ncbi:hypothetical protein [Polyangium fumosum]|uniref:Uncharacterized protein n=1 Tax=Polyangium fumosum TaxID=889272 RepID=A0A4U1IVV1_9BACT|nr:hypothetical protein [Polyangium fumosum]TKC98649.1 hypothetical protein E8A74_40480 [Polyangium fumosum]
MIRRLRRNGRLPAWVCAEPVDTRVANRQDLLVELAIKIEGKPIEEAVAMAKDLVENPPKYGPRTTPKAAPADHDVTDSVAEPDVKAPTETLVPVTVEDWTLFTSDGGEHWLRDLDLAEKAALANPHDIRTTIQKALADGLVRDAMTILGGAENGPLVHEVKVQVAIGSGAKRWVPEYYLNEEAALLLVTRLRMPKAIELTKAIVRVFLAVVRGEVPQKTHAPVDDVSAEEQRLRLLALRQKSAIELYAAIPVPQNHFCATKPSAPHRTAGRRLVFDDQHFAAKRAPRTTEYWLNEEQALFVTTQL